jgi:MFS transporter, DHA1 family, multidrug resistance protein
VKLGWRGATYLATLAQAVQAATEGHLIAFTPVLLREMGLPDAEIGVWSGLLYGLMTTMAFTLAPFWGVIAERFSRKAVIVRSYYFLVLALLIAAWAPDVKFLIVSRLFVGLCFGTIGILFGSLAVLVPRDRLGSSIATVQVSQPIATSLGPLFGALTIPYLTLRGLFVVDAVLVLVAGIVLTVLLPEFTKPNKDGSVLGRMGEVLAYVVKTPVVRWNYLCACIVRGSAAVVDSYLPVRITQLAPDPAQAIGVILGLAGFGSIASTWVLRSFIDRVNISRAMIWIMLASAILTAGLALSPWLLLIGVLAVARALPVAWGNSLLHAHTAKPTNSDL